MKELMKNKIQIPDFSANKGWRNDIEEDADEVFARKQEEAEAEASYIQYLESLN